MGKLSAVETEKMLIAEEQSDEFLISLMEKASSSLVRLEKAPRYNRGTVKKIRELRSILGLFRDTCFSDQELARKANHILPNITNILAKSPFQKKKASGNWP